MKFLLKLMGSILLIALLFFLFEGIQNKTNKVVIIVESKNISDTAKIFIAGNNMQLGNWTPNDVMLNRINDSTWKKTFSFELGTKLEFKFTQGSWLSEALDSNGTVQANYFFTVKKDTAIKFIINNWKKDTAKKNYGQITGVVKYHSNFKGKGIKPRDVIVWLPPGYDEEVNDRYPVLYMHDGQNIIDPNTSSFGVDWQLDETADSLIKANAIQKIIIVGIYNTNLRSKEYADTDIGRSYRHFIVNELKPFIDETYRTKPDAANTATAGSSLGGLVSFMLVWEFPNVFSKTACISPAFFIEDIDYLTAVKNYSSYKKPIKVYIDDGGVGLEERLQPGIDSMLVLLKQNNYQMGKDLMFYKDSTAQHSETAWAQRTWRFLEFFFGN